MRRAVVALALVGCGKTAAKIDAAPPPERPADPVAIGDPIARPVWSANGKHVAFAIQPHEFDKWARADVYLVVDVKTHVSFAIDNISQIEFAADGQHLAVVAHGAVEVYDLATHKSIAVPSPVLGGFQLTPAELYWMGPDLAIHRRELASGHEVVFAGLPKGEAARFETDTAGRVIAHDTAGIRAWSADGASMVSVDDAIGDVEISDEGIAYIRKPDDKHAFFGYVALVPGAVPLAWPKKGACKRGEVDEYSSIHPCGPNRYLVRGTHDFCVWDTEHGVLRSHFGPIHDEYGCADELAYAGDLPPGGPYTFWDLRTGHHKKEPRDFHPPEEGDEPGDIVPIDCPGVAKDYSYGSQCMTSGQKDRIAGPLEGRATLWSADGKIEWQAPSPSHVAAVAFAPHQLAIAGTRGEVWHLDFATRALTHGALISPCELDDQEPIAVTADGKVVAPCQHDRTRTLALEGGTALAKLDDYGWYPTAAANTIGWLSGDGAHAYALDGKERWTYDVDHYGFALTGDGSRFAVTSVVGDHGRPSAYDVSVRDAANKVIATVRLDTAPKSLALSPNGMWLAVIGEAETAVIDVAHGKVVDHLPVHHNPPARHDVVAWAPDGSPRLAYWRPKPAALVIRDVAALRDLETRLPSRAIDGTVRILAWSADGIAAVADDRVTLWEGDRPSSQVGFAGDAGVEVGADGRAHALGGTRSLFASP